MANLLERLRFPNLLAGGTFWSDTGLFFESAGVSTAQWKGGCCRAAEMFQEGVPCLSHSPQYFLTPSETERRIKVNKLKTVHGFLFTVSAKIVVS